MVTPGGNLAGLRKAGIGTANGIHDQLAAGKLKGLFVFGEDLWEPDFCLQLISKARTACSSIPLDD